jgi:hypothetical protein
MQCVAGYAHSRVIYPSCLVYGTEGVVRVYQGDWEIQNQLLIEGLSELIRLLHGVK